MFCGSKYTYEKKAQRYNAKVQEQALRRYVDGTNLYRTARQLGVHHTSIMHWVKEYASPLPAAPQPKKVKTAELDEQFTFIDKKKVKTRQVTGVISQISSGG